MDSIEFINEILKHKKSSIYKELIEDAVRIIREKNIKYKLLDKVINNQELDPLLIKISDIKELHEIFIESLVGMDKVSFNNYLANLSRKKKLKYLFENLNTISINCDFEKNLLIEYIYLYNNRSFKDIFNNKYFVESIYLYCLEKLGLEKPIVKESVDLTITN